LLNTTNIRNKAISWTSNINLTVYRNKLVSYPDLENSSYAGLYTIGKSLNIKKLFHYAGVNSATGVYQFYDSKNNIVGIPEFTIDQIVQLDRNPKWYGGFENTFSFKGFELDFLFQYVKQMGATNKIGARPGLFNRNQPLSVLEHWQKPGDNSYIQRFSTGSAISFPNSLTLISDASYTDASYLRLKNLSLSWRVPKDFTGKLHVDNCRFFFRAQNLLTITNYEGGLDPETMNVTSLPPLRTITFGVNVKF
jgi:TonB-dependent starch-binding outer membrane protein SusC